jgi:thiamine-triphosphatase
MIEVEKKFLLASADLEKLIFQSQFISQKSLTDVYYDTIGFSLTTKDIWLRSRNDRFELKIPAGNQTERLIDQYRELEDEAEIFDYLKLSPRASLQESLNLAGYFPFCNLKTVRSKYKIEDFTIDVDQTEAGDFKYSLVEIELMVSTESKTAHALDKIKRFSAKHNLSDGRVRGKVIEFLKQQRPEHYTALVKAGVVKDF